MTHSHLILIISGGAGASGEQLVGTVLAQFPQSGVRLVTVPSVRTVEQIDDVVARAGQSGATLVHTLVDAGLRAHLIEQAGEQGVVEIDLMGALFGRLAQVLGQEPLGQPGLYRQLNRTYFDRVAAIEYTMANDDGKNANGLAQAEIVLCGVSRVGKTPLSMYLAVLGWKVANVPLVPGIDPPPELFHIERERAIGLTVEAGQLIAFRQQRQQRLGAGVGGGGDYTDPAKVYEELEDARRFCRRCGFTVLDTTDKPIETTADEIIRLITARFGLQDRVNTSYYNPGFTTSGR